LNLQQSLWAPQSGGWLVQGSRQSPSWFKIFLYGAGGVVFTGIGAIMTFARLD